MNRNTLGDDYRVFPYRPDAADGRTNNGGIDLVREPNRIDEITEAANFPELRRLLVDVNAPHRPCMTLGCEAGIDAGRFLGYVEFAFREQSFASDENFISGIDQEFAAWIQRKSPQIAAEILRAIHWEYSPFSYFGSAQRLKIAFFHHSSNQNSAGQLLDLLRHFLLVEIQTPSKKDDR